MNNNTHIFTFKCTSRRFLPKFINIHLQQTPTRRANRTGNQYNNCVLQGKRPYICIKHHQSSSKHHAKHIIDWSKQKRGIYKRKLHKHLRTTSDL